MRRIASWSGWRCSACSRTAAEERPLVCVVDDAQWLDRRRRRCSAFVARRLLAESVVAAVRARASRARRRCAGLPELRRRGPRRRRRPRSCWPRSSGDRSTSGCASGSSPRRAATRWRCWSCRAGSTPAQLAGGFGLPDALSLSSRIEESFQQRLEPLPDGHPAAAAGRGGRAGRRPALLWRAAERLGIRAEARAPAERPACSRSVRGCGFVIRSCARRSTARRRRRSGSARTGAGRGDRSRGRSRSARLAPRPGDRRPDEDVAAELERSAGRAQARGGWRRRPPSSSAPAELTPDPARRAQRALAAAQAKLRGRRARRALALLGHRRRRARSTSSSAPGCELLRAQIAFAARARQRRAAAAAARPPSGSSHSTPRLARETYLDALAAALFAGRLAAAAASLEVAEAARAAPPPSQPPRPRRSLLDGLALAVHRGLCGRRRRCSKRALSAFRERDRRPARSIRWLLARLPAPLSTSGTTRRWHVLSTRHVQLAREAGALTVLPLALDHRAARAPVSPASFAAAAVAARGGATRHRGDRQPLAPYDARCCSPPGAAARPSSPS